MRTSTLVGMFAGAVLALSTAGIAFAAPAVPTPVPAAPTPVPTGAASVPTGLTTPSQQGSPAAVFVSSASVRPGTTVHVSGTCALPASGTAAMPTVVSVTSPAFVGPERFSKTDPDAFDGTATISRTTAPGHYPVMLTCSNSTASTVVRVIGSEEHSAGRPGHAAAAPAPGGVPVVHHAGPAVQAHDDPSSKPWLGVGIGALAVAVAGAGTYVVTRSRQRIRA
ncbi:hypothetical protein [Kribbella sp. CA-247076]|uniref:hypothetical protein n=1 Tax=Kribbella sp. CA-247076 TaxID=3239941 RepID=UPI003D8DB489